MKTKFYGLDHLRALAILLVFLFHYFLLSGGQPGWLTGKLKLGWTGVDLFFVLSGFLISNQLFEQIRTKQSISLRQFFIKRFFRIIPAFWFIVGIYFLVPVFHERESLPPLWKFLTFTHNLDMDIRDGGTFSHAWSLCVEEHFYLLLPFLLILLQMIKVFKWSYWIIILLFLFGIGIRFYIFQNWYLPVPEDQDPWWYWYKYIYYPTYSRLDSLLVGVSIAAIYQFSPKLWSKLSRYGNVFILVSLILLTGAYFICYDQMSFNASIWGFPMVALGYGFLLTGALCPTSFLYKWDSSLTTFIASISYALYLSHKGIIHICHIFLKDYELNPNLLLLVSLAVSIAVAYLLYRIIEKPFMQLRDRIVKTK